MTDADNRSLAVLLDRDSLDRGDLDLTRLRATPFDWRFFPKTRPEQTLERIGEARLVITNKVQLDREILERTPRLRWICVAATGTNNVDLEAATERGIGVLNVAGYATASVVQHVFALMLALSTRLMEYRAAVGDGAWRRSDHFCLLDFPIRELTGRTLGIVGYGELGHAVARVAQAFGLRILLAQRPGGTPRAGRLPLPELLPQVDVLSLHCPLADNTRNLIGAAELAMMRPDALLINTARGGIVDERALADALRERRLAGAGVDVLIREPPVDGNPLLAKDIPNLIVTPHIAWASRESRQRLIDAVAENVWRCAQQRKNGN